MEEYKNLKLEPADGGFIVSYDLYGKQGHDQYGNMCFLCSKREVFENPKDAIKRLMSLYGEDNFEMEDEKEDEDEIEVEVPKKNLAKLLFGKTMRGDETPNLSSKGMESALGNV